MNIIPHFLTVSEFACKTLVFSNNVSVFSCRFGVLTWNRHLSDKQAVKVIILQLMVALEEKNPALHPVFVTRLNVRGSAQQLVFCAHHDYVLHILWQCCGDVSPEKRSRDQQSKSENKSFGDLLAFILPLCHSHALINYTGTVHNWLFIVYVCR